MTTAGCRYQIGQYDKAGRFVAVVAGAGKNRGTWDTDHSRAAAYRHCAAMNAKSGFRAYRVLRMWGAS